MIKSNYLFISCFLLICAGCSTGYHSEGLVGGGYTEIKKAPDIYFVTFTGNEYTSAETVQQYAYRRAAEVTLENGYTYFAVIQSYDKTKKGEIPNEDMKTKILGGKDPNFFPATSHINSVSQGASFSEIIHQPRFTLEIRCFHEKPDDKEVIDAIFLK